MLAEFQKIHIQLNKRLGQIRLKISDDDKRFDGALSQSIKLMAVISLSLDYRKATKRYLIGNSDFWLNITFVKIFYKISVSTIVGILASH